MDNSHLEVLMVDDEPDLDFLIKQRFRHKIQQGELTFHFARNGTQALEVLENNPTISHVITDLNMPQMNGLELLLQVKNHYPYICNVVISAYGDQQTIQEALNIGASYFLTKPLNFADFEKILNGEKSPEKSQFTCA